MRVASFAWNQGHRVSRKSAVAIGMVPITGVRLVIKMQTCKPCCHVPRRGRRFPQPRRTLPSCPHRRPPHDQPRWHDPALQGESRFGPPRGPVASRLRSQPSGLVAGRSGIKRVYWPARKKLNPAEDRGRWTEREKWLAVWAQLTSASRRLVHPGPPAAPSPCFTRSQKKQLCVVATPPTDTAAQRELVKCR